MLCLNRRRLLLAALALATAGCGPFVRTPRLASPGSSATQQVDALFHDPYPIDDLGPAVVGGRPLGYQNSVPPERRGRLLRGTQTVIPRTPTVVPQAQPALPTTGF